MAALQKPLRRTTLRNGEEVAVGNIFPYLKRLREFATANPGLVLRLLKAAKNDGRGAFSSSERETLQRGNFIGSHAEHGVSVLMRDAVRIINTSVSIGLDDKPELRNPVPERSDGWQEAELALGR